MTVTRVPVTVPRMGKRITLPLLKCLRCGYSWFPKKPVYPKRCAKCGSPYWAEPREAE